MKSQIPYRTDYYPQSSQPMPPVQSQPKLKAPKQNQRMITNTEREYIKSLIKKDIEKLEDEKRFLERLSRKINIQN